MRPTENNRLPHQPLTASPLDATDIFLVLLTLHRLLDRVDKLVGHDTVLPGTYQKSLRSKKDKTVTAKKDKDRALREVDELFSERSDAN